MNQGSFYLLRKQHFLPLFLTQFFGAFNDNAFKLAMLTLISYNLSHSQVQSERYQAIAGALFTLPFFLFSATAGQIADKLDKAKMSRYLKGFELLLMMIGGMGLYFGHIALLMITLTGMGIHSSFFGPIKYAILPDHLPKSSLLGATGLIESSTFLAILLGTTLGTLAIGTDKGSTYLAILLTNFAAVAGLTSSFFIPKAPPHTENDFKIDWNILRATFVMLKEVKEQSDLFVPILTISWFWLIGVVVLTKLPDYTHYVLNADNIVFALFLALFSVGIGIGSLLINRLLSGRVSLYYVPLSIFILSCFAFDLYLASSVTEEKTSMYSIINFFFSFRHWRISFDLLMLAVSAGLFVVPLYTHLQVFSRAGSRARTIAANNIYNALFMVVGTLLVMFLIYLNLSIPEVFLILSILNAIVAFSLWWILPGAGGRTNA
ncbi:MFS transporter [Legionella israelensis]|uniref:MFS transporter n=1 Tax=Legionella israelensis TaxID=454 RepID=A0AAX1EGV3_9GAMM|nr:MFS transporter [Legionella israelensis]QBR84054.1 MFS transporter [Legionella israelensis]